MNAVCSLLPSQGNQKSSEAFLGSCPSLHLTSSWAELIPEAVTAEAKSKVGTRDAKGWRWGGAALGWIIQSLQDWLLDMAGHQREMSLCEMMEYARVNPVRAIAPRTSRFSTGNGSPMTSSNGVKYRKGDSHPTHSSAGHSF